MENYVVEYKDDFNNKYITYTHSFKDIEFLQERFTPMNVRYEEISYYPKGDAGTGCIGKFSI